MDCLLVGLLSPKTDQRWTSDQIRSCQWLRNETFIKEFDPFPSNLSNYSRSIDKNNSSELSLEDQAHLKLQELGITPEIFQSIYGDANQKHDHINGTYRIIFHRLQKQSNALEHDETYDKRMKTERPPSWIRSISYTNGVDDDKYSKQAHLHGTSVCTIL